MTRRDHESPADHARRIIAERRQREAEALRQATAHKPFVDMGDPRLTRYQTASGPRIARRDPSET